jgi:hypothetical protein
MTDTNIIIISDINDNIVPITKSKKIYQYKRINHYCEFLDRYRDCLDSDKKIIIEEFKKIDKIVDEVIEKLYTNRTNILDYMFITNKLCDKNKIKFNEYIPLKSFEKILIQLNIWKEICKKLNYEYDYENDRAENVIRCYSKILN